MDVSAGVTVFDQPKQIALIGALVGIGIYYLFGGTLQRSKQAVVLSVVIGAGLALLGFALSQQLGWTFPGWDWVAVGVLGAGVAVGELVSRFQDEPTRTLRTTPAALYVLLNSGAAVAALMMVEAVGWTIQSPGGGAAASSVHWPQVLTAGLGAMALLRSAIFTVRVGSQDVAVGPSTFLQAIVDATDASLDRLRAQDRAKTAAQLMDRVIYGKALAELPTYCLRLLQNFPDDRKTDFLKKIDSLSNGDDARLSDSTKLQLLALYCMTFFGERVVQSAIASLNSELVEATRAAADQATTAQRVAGRVKGAAQSISESAKNVQERLTHTPGVPEPVRAAAAANEQKAAELEHTAAEAEQAISTAAAAAEHAADLAAARAPLVPDRPEGLPLGNMPKHGTTAATSSN